MSLTEDNYDNLKEMIYSRYEANPSMETLADLEYIVNESMLDDSINFTQCQRLRDIIDEMKRPSKHAKTTKGAKKKVKELNVELASKFKVQKENDVSKLKAGLTERIKARTEAALYRANKKKRMGVK